MALPNGTVVTLTNTLLGTTVPHVVVGRNWAFDRLTSYTMQPEGTCAHFTFAADTVEAAA